MKKPTKRPTIILFLMPIIVGLIVVGIFLPFALKSTNKKIQPTPAPTINNGLNDHGTINNGNLSVSAFKTYVEKLGFNKFNKLSLLQDQELKQKLANEYPGVTVKVADGSNESTGTLILEFSGHDNNNIVSGTAKITGFETYDADAYSLQDIKVNLGNWFDKQLPLLKQNKQTIDVSTINKTNLLTDLVRSANVVIWKNQLSSLIPLTDALKSLQVSATLKNSSSNKKPNSNNYSLQLTSATISFKSFDGTRWKLSTSKTIIADSSKPSNFPVPTLTDLKDHMLGEINVKSDAAYTNYYPSYFRSKWEVSKEISDSDSTRLQEFTNYGEIENKYSTYLNQTPKTNLSFKVATDDVLISDDDHGTLVFSMQLKEAGVVIGTKNTLKNKKFQLSGMKQLTTFISSKKTEINNFQITNNSSLKFFQKILSILQKNKNQVINFFNGTNNSTTLAVDANSLNSTLTFINNNHYFFSAEEDPNKWKKTADKLIQWNDSLYLFNQSLNVNDSNQNSVSNCNLNNKDAATEQQPNLYICNNDIHSAFYLNTLKYTFSENKDHKIILTLTKNNNNNITITFNGQAIVGFSDPSKPDVSFETKFILNNLAKNQLG